MSNGLPLHDAVTFEIFDQEVNRPLIDAGATVLSRHDQINPMPAYPPDRESLAQLVTATQGYDSVSYEDLLEVAPDLPRKFLELINRYHDTPQIEFSRLRLLPSPSKYPAAVIRAAIGHAARARQAGEAQRFAQANEVLPYVRQLCGGASLIVKEYFKGLHNDLPGASMWSTRRVGEAGKTTFCGARVMTYVQPPDPQTGEPMEPYVTSRLVVPDTDNLEFNPEFLRYVATWDRINDHQSMSFEEALDWSNWLVAKERAG